MPITLSSSSGRQKLISALFDNRKKKNEHVTRVASIGAGRRGARTRSRFLSLQSSVVDRLRCARDSMEERSDLGRLLNPRDAIAVEARIREILLLAEEEWRELNDLHGGEVNKRRSKFTAEELDAQCRS
jgi:hypothetical protein